MLTKFDIDTYIKNLNTPALNEAVSSDSRGDKLAIYNLLRERLMPGLVSVQPLNNPIGNIFGKTRTISNKSALEFAQNGEFYEALVPKTYVKDDVFAYKNAVYKVLKEITFETKDDFFVDIDVNDAFNTGYIEHLMYYTSFGVGKLNVSAHSMYTHIKVSQEFLQDVDAAFGASLVDDALVHSASELLNKRFVHFAQKTAVPGEQFNVQTSDYSTARNLAQAIQAEALKVKKATGNECNWVLCSEKVFSLLSISGLIDADGFLGELDVRFDEFYSKEDSEYFLVGFAHDFKDGEYQRASYVWCPYVNDILSVLDTSSMHEHRAVQIRGSISVAPYDSELQAGDVMELHLGKNKNARVSTVVFA